MKKTQFSLKVVLALVLFAGSNLSCSKEDNEQVNDADPIVGTWNLRAIHDGQQGRDVSNEACFKDSRFVIEREVMNLTLSVPDSDGDGCERETLNAAWENDAGNYYLVNGDERQLAGISLNDGNETLQMMVTVNGQQIALIFRK